MCRRPEPDPWPEYPLARRRSAQQNTAASVYRLPDVGVNGPPQRDRESRECKVILNGAAHERQENVNREEDCRLCRDVKRAASALEATVDNFPQNTVYIHTLMEVSKAEKSFHCTSACICEQQYIFFFKLDT